MMVINDCRDIEGFSFKIWLFSLIFLMKNIFSLPFFLHKKGINKIGTKTKYGKNINQFS
jgi:hypothetical protein